MRDPVSSSLAGSESASAKPRREGDQLFLLIICFLYALGVTIAWLPEMEALQRTIPPGVALTVAGLLAFLRQGKTLITPSAVAAYAVVIFAGFPAIYVGLGLLPMRIQPSDHALVTAVNLNFLLLLGVLAICPSWPGSWTSRDGIPRPSTPFARKTVAWGLGSLLLFAIALVSSGANQDFIASLSGLGAVLLAGVGAFWCGERVSIGALAILALVGFGYAEFIFTGFGRLVLAFIGVAVAIMASIRFRTVWVKGAILLGTGPALVYLSLSRLEFLSQVRGADAVASEGIGSVVGPLVSSAVIIDASNQGSLVPSLGGTVLIALLFWVPREIWASKPPGFGREIVPVTQPHLIAETAHSDAGTLVGEAVWNFGVPFAWVFLLATVLLIRLLDANFARVTRSEASMPEALLMVVASASFVHLLWGGYFSQLSRVGVLIGILIVLMSFKSFQRSGS